MTEEQRIREAEDQVMDSIKFSRVIIPVLIGVAVVAYLLWRQFDPAEFAKIDWTFHTLAWVLVGALILVIRHLAYAARLYMLAEGFFSFRKCIQLIFIWEFSSAITPTMIGGTAVALFVLSREKLPVARTATIVIYTVVLDTLVFLLFLPLLFLFFGTSIIRPNMDHFWDLDGWGVTFLITLGVMASYGLFFYYGLFKNPGQFKRIIVWATYNRFLKRFRHQAIQLGNDIILASKNLARHSFRFHLVAFFHTSIAWIGRFAVLNALIIGIVPGPVASWVDQIILFSRLMTMHVIMAFSPTPGGSGLTEYVFGGFLSDFVPMGIALIIAFLWRLMSYYFYLFAGVIILPSWLQSNIRRRRKREG